MLVKVKLSIIILIMEESESSGIVETKRNVPITYKSLIEAAMNGKINFSPPVSQLRRFIEEMFRLSRLTEPGKELKQLFEGKTIIDLGCGTPGNSLLLRQFIKTCKAKAYIGVDIHPSSETKTEESESMLTVWRREDILGFLSKMEPVEDTVLILSGIDAEDSELSRQYFNAVNTEVLRVTGPNTAIIIGPFTHHLDLESKFGIGKVYKDRHGLMEMKVLLPKTHLDQEKEK